LLHEPRAQDAHESGKHQQVGLPALEFGRGSPVKSLARLEIAVLDAGDEWHGSTVHFVTEELDGGPRILQGRIPVAPSTSADALMQRVQAVEHRIYPEAANWFARGRLEYRDDAAWLDGAPLPEPVILDFD
jgi:hypothetical protein